MPVGHIEELFKGVQVAVPAKSRSGDLGARLFATESNETPDFVESGSTVNEETEEDVRGRRSNRRGNLSRLGGLVGAATEFAT